MNLSSRDLSRNLVGICVQAPERIDDLLRHIQPIDLEPPWSTVLEAAINLLATYGTVDEITVANLAAKTTPGITPLMVHEAVTGSSPAHFDVHFDQMREGLRVRRWWDAAQGIAQASRIEDRRIAEQRIHDLVSGATEACERLRSTPRVTSVHELLTTAYPEPRWAVPGLVPAGLTLFAGPPKVGKSGVVLDLGLGVAMGGKALSSLNCNQGAVLYLSLDNDTERRLQHRTRRLMSGEPIPPGLEFDFVTDGWPIGSQAIAACQDWVASKDETALMVVVDTLVKVEPEFEGNGTTNAYAHSTRVLTRWSEFAHRNNLAVVMVHHDRKTEADDWLNRFSGSRGLTATAQTLLMLDAKRGEHNGLLRVSGRDIVTDDLTLHRVAEFWTVVDLLSGNNNAPAAPLRSV